MYIALFLAPNRNIGNMSPLAQLKHRGRRDRVRRAGVASVSPAALYKAAFSHPPQWPQSGPELSRVAIKKDEKDENEGQGLLFDGTPPSVAIRNQRDGPFFRQRNVVHHQKTRTKED
jgi:hypothetical protein